MDNLSYEKNNLVKLFENAECLMKSKNYLDAIGVWKKIIDLFPEQIKAYARCIEAFTAINKFSEAEKIIQLAFKINEDAIPVLHARANMLFKQKNISEALKAWKIYIDKCPKNSLGYSRAALCHLEISDIKNAKIECENGFDNTEPSLELYLTYGKILDRLNEKEKFSSLVREAIRKFPNNPKPWLELIKYSLRNNDYVNAQKDMASALQLFPKDRELLYIYGDISFKQKNFLEAIEHWKKIIDLFPHDSRAYTGCIYAASLLINKTLAMQYFQMAKTCVSDQLALMLMEYRVLYEFKKYTKALDISKQIIDMYPHKIDGYRCAANVSSQLGKYKDSADFCLEALNINPGNEAILSLLIDNCAKVKRNSIYIKFLKENINIISANINNLISFIKLLIYTGHTFTAKSMIFMWLQKNKNNKHIMDFLAELVYANLYSPFITLNNSVCEAFSDIFNYYNEFKLKREFFTLFFNLTFFKSKILFDNSYIHKIIFIHSIIKENVNINKKINRRILFICNLSTFKQILPVLLKVTKKNCSVYITNFNKDIFFNKYIGVAEKLNIVNNEDDIKNYEILVCGKENIKYSSPSQHIILLSHSIDLTFDKDLERCHGVIYACEKQTEYNTILILNDEKEQLHNISTDNKCEVTYTGPYHLDDCLNIDKITLREQISIKYKFDIPFDKPLIFFLEDTLSYLGQIIYCLNKLSLFATVIFKPDPSHNYIKNRYSKLSSNVLLITEQNYASNEFRFASDYIFAGIKSGSVMSSIMAGNIVIPYYSRLVKRKHNMYNDLSPFPYSCMLNTHHNNYKRIPSYLSNNKLSSSDIIINFFINSGYIFDLLDIPKIHDAITTSSFISWYIENLPHVRELAFGDYNLHNSAELTAKYIIDYSHNLTFGKYCNSLYLKDNFFINK